MKLSCGIITKLLPLVFHRSVATKLPPDCYPVIKFRIIIGLVRVGTDGRCLSFFIPFL